MPAAADADRRAASWMAESSPAMTIKGLIEREIVMPGLDPGIHARESTSGASGMIEKEIVMPGLDPGIHVRESMSGPTGNIEKEIVMPGLDPGIHARESMPGSSGTKSTSTRNITNMQQKGQADVIAARRFFLAGSNSDR